MGVSGLLERPDDVAIGVEETEVRDVRCTEVLLPPGVLEEAPWLEHGRLFEGLRVEEGRVVPVGRGELLSHFHELARPTM